MVENNLIKAFIDEIRDIRFLSVDDFMKRKEFIRSKFSFLDESSKEIYKWYFYHQLCCLPQQQFELKDLMWMYVNNERVELDLALKYKIFCQKRSKIKYND